MRNSQLLSQPLYLQQPESVNQQNYENLLYLKQKLQSIDCNQNSKPQSSEMNRDSRKIRPESYSRQKQPTFYSLYKKLNTSQDTSNDNIFGDNTVESVKNYLSIQYAKVLNVPIIKITQKLNRRDYEEPTISQLLWAKYNIKKEKYIKRQNRQQLIKISNKIQTIPKNTVSFQIKNQAVKNYQRKIKSSQLISNQSTIFDENFITNVNRKINCYSTHCESQGKTRQFNSNNSFT